MLRTEKILDILMNILLCALWYISLILSSPHGWCVAEKAVGNACWVGFSFIFLKTKSHKEYVVVLLSWHSWCRWHFVKLKTLECGNCKRVQTEGFFVSILRIPTCFFVGKVQRAHIFFTTFYYNCNMIVIGEEKNSEFMFKWWSSHNSGFQLTQLVKFLMVE